MFRLFRHEISKFFFGGGGSQSGPDTLTLLNPDSKHCLCLAGKQSNNNIHANLISMIITSAISGRCKCLLFSPRGPLFSSKELFALRFSVDDGLGGDDKLRLHRRDTPHHLKNKRISQQVVVVVVVFVVVGRLAVVQIEPLGKYLWEVVVHHTFDLASVCFISRVFHQNISSTLCCGSA